MWLLMAMFGALMGSSVVDLAMRGQPAGEGEGEGEGGDDTADDSATGWHEGDAPSLRAGDGGDLLDPAWSADPDFAASPDEPDDMADAGEIEADEIWVGPPPDPDPDPHPEPADPWLDGWTEDEYLSTDSPDPGRQATDDLPDTVLSPDAGSGEFQGTPGTGARAGEIWVGPPPDPDPEPDPDPGTPPDSDPDPETADPWLDGWTEDEYLSTDSPAPDPQGQFLQLGDGGGYLRGGDGDDTLIGGAGEDWIEGGAGNDLLIGGAGDDTLIGGPGASTLLGGAGDDRLIAGGGPALMFAGEGDNHLLGGEHDDTLIGGTGSDTLVGGLGDDLLVAGLGPGELDGGGGDDTLVGARLDGQGRDIGGAQVLNGGAGDDLLILGRGDLAHGGEGADSFVLGDWLPGDAPARIVDFTPGEDRMVLTHSASGPVPVLQVSHDPTSGESAIRVDGRTVALVIDPDGGLRAEDVELVPYQPGPGGGATLDGVLRAVAGP